MILFLYGEDAYRSKQKLDAIKAKYIDKSLGDTNLSVLDFEDKTINFDQVVREMLAFPFLANSRLVVTKNLLLSGKKDIQDKIKNFLPKVPASTNIVIYEGGLPDKRVALFKYLSKPKISEEFKFLENHKLRKWVIDEVEKLGGSIEESATEIIIEYVGNDLWRMSNEIKKLTAYSLKLKAQDVEALVKPKIEGNIFGMIDAIGQQNSKAAIKFLHDLVDSGENELYIFTMIVYQFRNLLIVKDAIKNSKQVSNFQLAKQVGLNPYVVEKTIKQASGLTFNELKKIYEKLLDYDIKMKTGKIDPSIALDVLVLELYKN